MEKQPPLLIHGDSLIGGILHEDYGIDAIITDPPYHISKVNHLQTLKGRQGIDFGGWDHDFSPTAWISLWWPKLKKGGTLLIFCSYLYVSHIIDEINRLGGDVKDLIRWVKPNPMPRNTSRRYVNDCEYIVWAVKRGAKWTFNKVEEPYLRPEYKGAAPSKRSHPNGKPLALMEQLIKIHTCPDDLLVDPFMGTGTTLLAAKRLGRISLGYELDINYFKATQKKVEDK